jgi:hypothetical protein
MSQKFSQAVLTGSLHHVYTAMVNGRLAGPLSPIQAPLLSCRALAWLRHPTVDIGTKRGSTMGITVTITRTEFLRATRGVYTLTQLTQLFMNHLDISDSAQFRANRIALADIIEKLDDAFPDDADNVAGDDDK